MRDLLAVLLLFSGSSACLFAAERPNIVLILADEVAELLGAELPDEVAPDSVSFLPALRGEPIVSEREEWIQWVFADANDDGLRPGSQAVSVSLVPQRGNC